ncbi:MAG: HD-GYP domain-containing protein [Candidatus Wallbacteria bacterium]|nr:HD-GYP domain-containing protein [Candidatus Wallbacteria bacterium]
MKIEEWLTLSELRSGMIVARNVDYLGQTILTQGLVFTEEIISLLKDSVQLEHYPVLIEKKEARIVSLLDPDTVVVRDVSELFILISLFFEKSRTRKLQPREIKPLVEKLTRLSNAALDGRNDLFQIVRHRSGENYEATHAANMILLSLLISRKLGLSQEESLKIAMAAAFSDLGKTTLDRQLLSKREKLSKEDYQQIRQHIFRGIALIKDCFQLEEGVLLSIVQHHERYNGTGYPRGLSGDEIHPSGLLIGLCDVFDALTSDRPFRGAMSAYQAMKFILSFSGKTFPPYLVNALFKLLTFYPPGTTVELNTGEIGIVKYVNEEIMRPVVRMLFGQDKQKLKMPYTIDLSNLRDKYIVKVLEPGSVLL